MLLSLQTTLVPPFPHLWFRHLTGHNKQSGNTLTLHFVIGPKPLGNALPSLLGSTRCFGAPVHSLWWALGLSLPWDGLGGPGQGLVSLWQGYWGLLPTQHRPSVVLLCVCVHACVWTCLREECGQIPLLRCPWEQPKQGAIWVSPLAAFPLGSVGHVCRWAFCRRTSDHRSQHSYSAYSATKTRVWKP